ncbi:Uncharacterised protein [BD1-7 clade bacterium]|uniref:Uncharacterized protein n=1 Tax=BD1-7 clade bacterium TaxID=2029982 RepID=A0A5S9PYG9_9GAMM|nr:Uncharacterised protein [BD1-7 clade bacterium]CAA0113273.1 Uncharacterised protein [BD1-7 clade bacterium]
MRRDQQASAPSLISAKDLKIRHEVGQPIVSWVLGAKLYESESTM